MADDFDLPSAEQRSLEEKIADTWVDFYYGPGFGDVYIPKENDRWNALCDLLEDLRERVEASRCSKPESPDQLSGWLGGGWHHQREE